MSHREVLAGLASLVLAASAAAQSQPPKLVGNFPTIAVPPGNPMTAEKILLGKALFFEEQISADDTMACATCHLPEAGGGDPRAGARSPGDDGVLQSVDDEFGSPGVVAQNATGDYLADPVFGVTRQVTGRNSPSMINAVFFNHQFWDSRAGPVFTDLAGNVVLPELGSLESQAVGPPVSAVEMGHAQRTWDEITAKLATVRPLQLASNLPTELEQFLGNDTYPALFTLAFGSPEITRERIAMAIASYERTLVSDQTPFDLGTLTARQLAGLDAFVNRGTCETCHPSANKLFTDGEMQHIGLPNHMRDVKTPGLRNVGLRRRFMSSGQMTSISLVLQHYQQVGFFFPVPGDEGNLRDFLENGLTDPRVAGRLPPFDRPTLRSERDPSGSNLYGLSRAGTGNVRPAMLADSPPFLGNPDFKVGLGAAVSGSPALLLFSPRQSVVGANYLGVPLAVDLIGAQGVAVLTSGGGTATHHMALPSDPALLGRRFYAQWLVRDRGVTPRISATRGAEFELFAR